MTYDEIGLHTIVNESLILPLVKISNDNGYISFMSPTVSAPINYRRYFTLSGDKGARRGGHAHKRCTQVIVCIAGRIRIKMRDLKDEINIELNPNENSLLVKPGIWVDVDFLENSIVLVLATHEYDENEYIRDWNQFERFKA